MYSYLWTLKLKNMSISPYSFPGLKLDLNEKQQIKNNSKLLRYKITKEEILEIIADECGITVGQILNKSRKREVINGRFIFCGIMNDYFSYTLKRIGGVVGRDHTTVIHAVRKFKDRIRNEDDFRDLVNGVYNKIGI